MDDVISRQAALDALRDAENHAFNSFYKGLIKAHKIIADLPSAQPERKWISCSERLPEKPDNYPCCGIYRTYFLVTLESGCVKSLGYEFDSDMWQITGSPVIAWMPLPEPYQAERREDG